MCEIDKHANDFKIGRKFSRAIHVFRVNAAGVSASLKVENAARNGLGVGEITRAINGQNQRKLFAGKGIAPSDACFLDEKETRVFAESESPNARASVFASRAIKSAAQLPILPKRGFDALLKIGEQR